MMTLEQRAEWEKVRRYFVHSTGSPMRASALLLGVAMGFCLDAGHKSKGIIEKCRQILILSGHKIDQ
jgi:hypothetical protein